MAKLKKDRGYVLCLERGGYRVDLQVGKVYHIAASEKNDSLHLIRIVDDSDEDYLYPKGWFIPVDLPPKARRALAVAGA